jgi:CheY-like chemotaxis protein
MALPIISHSVIHDPATVLLVDDDRYSNQFIERVLMNAGAAILKAATGMEAINCCRENPELLLILMDGMMPGMTGYDATRKIREFNREVPIVILTAYAGVDTLRYSIECGCTGLLSKPIGKEELEALFRKTMQESKKHQGHCNDTKYSKIQSITKTEKP